MLSPNISASTAGFALAFANTVASDLLFIVRRFVALEQSMVAMERIKEYSDLKAEGPEFIEPRPPKSWPSTGNIEVKELVIRYAVSLVPPRLRRVLQASDPVSLSQPELPNVLHQVSFNIANGEKIGIVGEFERCLSFASSCLFADPRPLTSVSPGPTVRLKSLSSPFLHAQLITFIFIFALRDAERSVEPSLVPLARR